MNYFGKKADVLVRAKEIALILAKYGFKYMLDKRHWFPFPLKKPINTINTKLSVADRIPLVLQELGPTFVKMGQVLSTRPDLIPPEYAEKLSTLQDNVAPFPRELVKRKIVASFGLLPEELFAKFDYRPLASASIAQVHRATLNTGEEVVLKIQRPELARHVKRDLSAVNYMLPVLKKSMLGKLVDLEGVVSVFSRHIKKELNFNVEALNVEAFSKILADDSNIIVPKVHWKFTNEEILTLDYLDGQRIDEYLTSQKPSPDEREKLYKDLLTGILKPFFEAGVFHADPHPGNVLFTAKNELILLDYGIVGRLDQEFRYQTARLLIALKDKKVEELVDVILKLGVVTEEFDCNELYEDTGELMDKVSGVNLGEVGFADVLYGMIDISVNHKIKMAGSFLLLGKSLVTVERILGKLNPKGNLIDDIYPLAMAHLREELQPKVKEDSMVMTATNIARQASNIPRHFTQTMANFAEGKQKIIFQHQGLEPVSQELRLIAARIGQGFLLLGLLISSAIIISSEVGESFFGYSVLGLIIFLPTVYITFRLILKKQR